MCSHMKSIEVKLLDYLKSRPSQLISIYISVIIKVMCILCPLCRKGNSTLFPAVITGTQSNERVLAGNSDLIRGEKNEANLSVWCSSWFVLHSEAREAPPLISMLSWWKRQEIISALCTRLHTDLWWSCCLRDTETSHPPNTQTHSQTHDVRCQPASSKFVVFSLCFFFFFCPSLSLSRLSFVLFFILFFSSVVSVAQWIPCRRVPEAPPCLFYSSVPLSCCLLLSV